MNSIKIFRTEHCLLQTELHNHARWFQTLETDSGQATMHVACLMLSMFSTFLFHALSLHHLHQPLQTFSQHDVSCKCSRCPCRAWQSLRVFWFRCLLLISMAGYLSMSCISFYIFFVFRWPHLDLVSFLWKNFSTARSCLPWLRTRSVNIKCDYCTHGTET